MRTVTFIGLMTIGDALRNIAEMGRFPSFYTIILICCIVMDIVEFIKKMTDD